MPLVLEYPDKFRLWSELIQGSADRVFVRTEERFPVGASVPVSVRLPGVPQQVAMVGTVVSMAPAEGGRQPGVRVCFPVAEVDKCRLFLGLGPATPPETGARRSRRVRCDLEARILEPALEGSARVRNLSATGLLLCTPAALGNGQRVRGELVLDTGAVLPFLARVSWARRDRRMLGLQLRDVGAADAATLNACVERLAAADPSASARPTLVVADDEPNILSYLNRALSKHGYAVHNARHGEEALDLIRKLRPQLVILDILMPGIDGVDICKMMRADVEMSGIPTLFLSALPAPELDAVTATAGATGYLTKPVNLPDLIHRVGTYLQDSLLP